MEWQKVEKGLIPEKVELETKIVDAEGKEYNIQNLKFSGKLWWHPDMSMYVYYTPTHWRNLPLKPKN